MSRLLSIDRSLCQRVINAVQHQGAGAEVDLLIGDPSKAKRELGWEPTIPLREGLQKTIAYFDGLLSEQR